MSDKAGSSLPDLVGQVSKVIGGFVAIRDICNNIIMEGRAVTRMIEKQIELQERGGRFDKEALLRSAGYLEQTASMLRTLAGSDSVDLAAAKAALGRVKTSLPASRRGKKSRPLPRKGIDNTVAAVLTMALCANPIPETLEDGLALKYGRSWRDKKFGAAQEGVRGMRSIQFGTDIYTKDSYIRRQLGVARDLLKQMSNGVFPFTPSRELSGLHKILSENPERQKAALSRLEKWCNQR